VALLTGDLYQVMHYLDPRPGFKFLGYLDRNLYSRIARLTGGRQPPSKDLPNLRWAAAVLAFCQLAEITFDYASSIYELASSMGGDEAVEEIERFRVADNSDPRLFIDFALGRVSEIPKIALANVEEKVTDPAEFEKRTNEFRINYIFALKIAEVSRRRIADVDKMVVLIDWMRDGFMFGSPALFREPIFFPKEI
jgi:hypothetical protein